MQKVHFEAKPGCGLTPAVHRATCSVLRAIVPAMFKAQQPWALMGSTASVLQGIENYSPPDIDLVTTMQGAYIMSGCVGDCGATVRQLGFSTAGPYTSHFGIFEVDGVKVEVMGDLIIQVADGVIDVNDHFARWSDKVRVLHFEDHHVPVVPLEWQLVANVLLGRPERSTGIADFLLEHGYDRDYVDILLADKGYGDRTLNTVRQMLKI
jgi:hypothetical protein